MKGNAIMTLINDERKKKFQIFGIIFFFVYLFYAIFLNFSFTSDHVWAFTARSAMAKPIFKDYIAGGRPAVYILVWIEYVLDKLHINQNENQYIYQIILILLLSYAIYQLYILFSDVCKRNYQNILLVVILLIGFVNPYIVEAFVYKAIEWGIAINLVCCSIRLFTKRHYIPAGLLLWIGVSIYQSYFALFLIYTTAYLYMEYEGKLCKKVVAEAIKMYLTAFISIATNILLVKIIVAFGIVDNEVKVVDMTTALSDRIVNIWNAYQWAVIKCYGEMFPAYFMLAIILALTACTCVFLIKNKYHIVDIIYFVLLSVALNLYPFVIFSVASGVHQRITWPIFPAISTLLLILFYHAKVNNLKEKISFVLLALFWMVNIFYTNTAVNDFFISNKLDEFIVGQILEEIDDYEEETGESIQYIATVRAENKQNVYAEQNLSYVGDYYGIKMMARSWSDVSLINYLSGRNYIKVDMDENIYNTYFSGKSWTTFNADEQLVFVGDTMYWAIY